MPPIVTRPTGSTARTPGFEDAAKAWADTLDFGSAAARRLRVPRAQASTTGPAAVQRAHALHRTWEARDLGSTNLLRTQVDGRDLWAVHTTTDGDDGFLEIYNPRGTLMASGVTGPGRGGIQWDAQPGAVRDRLAPRDGSPEVGAFHAAVKDSMAPASASGARVSKDEARNAARVLLGQELTTASVDGTENAALARVLADHSGALTSGARAYVTRLSGLYQAQGPQAVSRVTSRAGESVLGSSTPFSAQTTYVTGKVGAGTGTARMDGFTALLLKAAAVWPSQVDPCTRTKATALLQEAGATSGEARKAIDALAAGGAELFVGQLFTAPGGTTPKGAGVAVFAALPDGNIRALVVKQEPVSNAGVPRSVIAALTGTDREVEVLGQRAVGGGVRYDLQWRPPSGGAIKAQLDVPGGGADATVGAVTVPAAMEPPLRAALAQHLETALGGPKDVVGYVGRDNSAGPGFVVAYRPQGSRDTPKLATIRIQLGGAATVTEKKLVAGDAELARDLALQIARHHAQGMVADPAIVDAARLEVALRTLWAKPEDLTVPVPAESPVGFDAAKERFQFSLGNVWGDNAVFVTFAKDGTLRVEDMN